jgi:hypothetical protein
METFDEAAVFHTIEFALGVIVFVLVCRYRFGRGAPNRILEIARADGRAAAAAEAACHPGNRYAQSLAEALDREDPAERSHWERLDVERLGGEIGRLRVGLILITLLAAGVPVAMGMIAYQSGQIAMLDAIAIMDDIDEATPQYVSDGIRDAAAHLSLGTRLGAAILVLGVIAFLLSGELRIGTRRLEEDHARLAEAL